MGGEFEVMAEVFVAKKLLSGQFGPGDTWGFPPPLKLSAMTASVTTLTSEDRKTVASSALTKTDYFSEYLVHHH